jgi:hypothetical protein
MDDAEGQRSSDGFSGNLENKPAYSTKGELDFKKNVQEIYGVRFQGNK